MSLNEYCVEIKRKCMHPICRECNDNKMMRYSNHGKEYMCEECYAIKTYDDISNINIKDLTYSNQNIRKFILSKPNPLNYTRAYVKLISHNNLQMYDNDTFIELLCNDLKNEKSNYHLFVLQKRLNIL